MEEKNRYTEKLAARLVSYGLTAGALAVTGSNATGQVVYSGIQNIVFDSAGVLHPLDLDGDDTIDFELGLAWDSYIFNAWTTNSAFIRNPGIANDWIGNAQRVYQLSTSYLISSARSWTDAINDYYNLGISYSGNFLGSGNALIGIRFIIHGATVTGHYGWLRVNIDAHATEITVVDWAYESTPYQPILSGVLDPELIPPEPVLSSSSNGGIVHRDFPIEIKFSEFINGFDISAIRVTGGSVLSGSFSTDDHIKYSATIRPEIEGMISVHVPGGVASDTNGNLSMPGANRIYAEYIEVPIPVLSANVEQPVSSPFQLVTEFNEDVVDLGEEDFVIANGRVETGSLIEINPSQYELTIIPERTGFVVIELPADVVQDTSSNGNLRAEPLNIEADLDSPHVILSTSNSQPVHGPFQVIITFDEVVEGLNEGNLRISNGFVSAGTLQTANHQIYSLTIHPARSGEVVMHLPENAARDEDGFGNLASEALVVVADLPSGLANNDYADEITCFPNPSSGSFILKTPLQLSNSELIIHNSSGREVYRTQIEKEETEINLGEISKGIYLVQIVNGDKHFVQKLILE